MYPVAFVAWLSLLLLASAETIVITVGGNTTSNPGAVFSPQTVKANQGDIVLFNFTQGTHSASQSTFAQPCVPAHKSNLSINGFDSSYREAGNYNSITQLTYVVTDPIQPIWFFDYSLCAKGGVGAINSNDSSSQTFAGFVRNALRLYGPQTSSSSASSPTKATTSSTPYFVSPSGTVSSANRAVVVGFYMAAPAILMLAALSL